MAIAGNGIVVLGGAPNGESFVYAPDGTVVYRWTFQYTLDGQPGTETFWFNTNNPAHEPFIEQDVLDDLLEELEGVASTGTDDSRDDDSRDDDGGDSAVASNDGGGFGDSV
jgi:hypothetical protein